MSRHHWRYEGGRMAQRNECERCGLVIGWDWSPRKWSAQDTAVRVSWLQECCPPGRQAWPTRKPLPPCKGHFAAPCDACAALSTVIFNEWPEPSKPPAPEPVMWMVIDPDADPDERVAALYRQRVGAETWLDEHYQIIPLYPGPFHEEWGFRYTDPKDSRHGNVYAQSSTREWPESCVKVALGMDKPVGVELVHRLVGEWEEVKP